MRLVVDTNVLFSALHSPEGPCGKIVLLAIEGDLELFAPMAVRTELERTVRAKLGYDDDAVAALLLALPVEWIEEALYAARLKEAEAAIRDATDAPVVAAALLLRADVVSSDRAFHPLRKAVVRTWRPKAASEQKKRR